MLQIHHHHYHRNQVRQIEINIRHIGHKQVLKTRVDKILEIVELHLVVQDLQVLFLVAIQEVMMIIFQI